MIWTIQMKKEMTAKVKKNLLLKILMIIEDNKKEEIFTNIIHKKK